MHRLTWTIDAAIGKYAGMFIVILTPIIGIASIRIHGRIVDIRLRIGKKL